MKTDKQREQLVEIVGCATREYAEYSAEMFNSGNYGMESFNEYVAYYLLRSGIIAPPYQIGETLYWVFNNKVIEITIEEIRYDKHGFSFRVKSEFNVRLTLRPRNLYYTREDALNSINKRR